MQKYIIQTCLFLCMFLMVAHSYAQNDKVVIPVSGACGMCQERIETTAKNVVGVVNAKYDLEKQSLTVETQNIFQKSDLVNALLAVGHDADGKKALDDIYENLHSCCKYRDEVHTEDDGHNHTESDGHDHSEHDGHDHGTDETLKGVVFEKLESGAMQPIIGANIVWLGETGGTVSDMKGNFDIPFSKKSKSLIVSYVGYSPDTLVVEKSGFVNIVISAPNLLDAVTITSKKRTTEISYIETVKVHNISSKELLKAACCNLAESFDTTPAVDASMTDAITGTRKIEMLGLAGPYVQITRENIPDVRGLAALQGLSFTPGAWVEGMQLNMGAGSVVNGFESITGQINVELRKPCHSEKFHLNAYASQAARLELNHFAKQEINENWSTATLLHVSSRNQRRDHNDDGFLDMPLGKQFGFINRWKWTNGEGQEGQIGAKISFMDNLSGQTSFRLNESDRTKVWGADMNTTRAEIWAKRGFVNLKTPYKTLGFQASAVYHIQDAMFGTRVYDATQKSGYFNMIYQSIIDNTDHQVRMGTSFQWDEFHETVGTTKYHRNEYVPGVFGEYTYKGSEKFSVLIGGRADYHNNFGLFFTPRLNVRYAPNQKTVFRLAGGRGQRTQSIFAENIGLFASNREIIVEGQNPNNPYGLDAEVAWNFGLSLTREIALGSRNLLISVDVNRIDFENQIVMDLDRSPQQVVFYNLKGESYSNSAQIQFEIDAAKWLDIRLAYRYNDVKTTYGEQLLQKPLVSPQRAFANTAFKFGRGWTFDYTINWLNSVRIPSTASNPSVYQWEKQSPSYFLSNTQINKAWANGFEVYIGGENIFDYKLHDPIIAADQPFGPYFDSSLAWGPIMGANVYVGMRYSL